jgi:hypothetical protein
MDRLLFGDNQFFGINHMSEEKARAQARQFQNISAVIAVLDAAYAEGLRTFMCTTHERIGAVCDHVRENPSRYRGFKFFPCMPYAHKYANAVTDHGMLGALAQFVPEEGVLRTALRGGISLARREVEGLAKILVDMEMRMFRGLETPVVFLQNVVVDLLLGMGMTDGFRIFHDYVGEKYGVEAGFISMNLPMLLDALDAVGIVNPIVCTSINKIGFRVSGGIDVYTETLRTRQVRAIAMSVLASGAIPPREALEWVAAQENIAAIAFGASSARNIRDTKLIVDDLFRRAA